jgi:hypothetical protein
MLQLLIPIFLGAMMHRKTIMDLKHPWDSKGTAFQPQCVIANDYGLIANSEKNNRKQTRIHKTAKKYNE